MAVHFVASCACAAVAIAEHFIILQPLLAVTAPPLPCRAGDCLNVTKGAEGVEGKISAQQNPIHPSGVLESRNHT